MKKISEEKIKRYIVENIQLFHNKIFERLLSLKLPDVLKRMNPYLFKAKSLDTSSDLVKSILDAYLSSQEETIFGEFLEQLAIYICKYVYSGKKSSTEGIDLEFEKDGIRYIVSIKSGPNWGNSSQITKMRDNLGKAKKILGTNTDKINVVAVNGCCYGKEKSSDKGDYLKLCGQDFWELVSGEKYFYLKIIEPLSYKAKERNEKFREEYAKVINRFTLEFSTRFCDITGAINWNTLVEFNSSGK